MLRSQYISYNHKSISPRSVTLFQSCVLDGEFRSCHHLCIPAINFQWLHSSLTIKSKLLAMFQDLVWSDPCLFLSCAPYLSEALVFFFLMCHVDIQFKDPVVAAPVPKTPSSQISNWLALLECQGSSHLGPPHRRLPGLPKLKYIHLLVTFYHCYTFFHFFVCLTLSPSNYNHHRGRAFILFTTMSSIPNITWHTIITKCCELMNVSSLPRKLLVPHHCHQSGHLYQGRW